MGLGRVVHRVGVAVAALALGTALLPAAASTVGADDGIPEGACPIGWTAELDTDGNVRCTHEDDVPPDATPVVAGRASVSPPDSCGTDGERVQVLWVRELGQEALGASRRASLETMLTRVDDIVEASVSREPGHREIRWHTTGDCDWDISDVIIPNGTLAGMGSMITALQSLGYNRSDRKYLTLTPSGSYCGIAQVYGDSRPDPNRNLNNGNGGAMFARVDARCLAYADVALHEIIHTFGSVLAAAPNATDYGHCNERRDVMCYEDGPGTVMRDAGCSRIGGFDQIDCNRDDYFAISPAPNSFLANNWNTADSSWWNTAEEPEPAPEPEPSSPLDAGAWTPLVGDFDGDGADDVLLYAPGADDGPMLWGNGDGSFVPVDGFDVRGTFEPFVGDFDGDGYDDVLWYRAGTGADYYWWGRSNRTFQSQWARINGTYRPVVADLDGDGADEIFWHAPGAPFDYLVDHLSRTSIRSTAYQVWGSYVPRAGDFDGNGYEDIFWYRPGPGAEYYWLFGETGRIGGGVPPRVNGTYDAVVGDFDADGDADIFWYKAGLGADYLWANQLEGAFTSTLRPVNGTYRVAVGDFDGDGSDDVFFHGPDRGLDVIWFDTSGSSIPVNVIDVD